MLPLLTDFHISPLCNISSVVVGKELKTQVPVGIFDCQFRTHPGPSEMQCGIFFLHALLKQEEFLDFLQTIHTETATNNTTARSRSRLIKMIKATQRANTLLAFKRQNQAEPEAWQQNCTIMFIGSSFWVQPPITQTSPSDAMGWCVKVTGESILLHLT